MRKCFLWCTLVVLWTLAIVANCVTHSQGDEPAAIPYADYPGLLMAKATEDKLRAVMPQTLSNRLENWSGLYYTSDEMPSAFQHHSGGTTGFHLSSYNLSADRNEPVGNNNEFPWKDPGGTHNSKVYTWKILQMPQGGKVRVFDTRLFEYNSVDGGYYVPGLDWTFPVGTRFVEVLSFVDELRPFEIRTREKMGVGQWQTRRFSQFRNQEDYLGTGGKVVSSGKWTYKDNHTTRPAIKETTVEIDVVSGNRGLLKDRPFVESRWAPQTNDAKGVVPIGYEGALAAKSCTECHASAADSVSKFSLDRSWYGHVRGSAGEKILSFHPVDPASISGNGFTVRPTPNGRLRGILQWEAK